MNIKEIKNSSIKLKKIPPVIPAKNFSFERGNMVYILFGLISDNRVCVVGFNSATINETHHVKSHLKIFVIPKEGWTHYPTIRVTTTKSPCIGFSMTQLMYRLTVSCVSCEMSAR